MRFALIFALAISAAVDDAGTTIKLLRDYHLKPPRDRHIVFAMAITPDQDVLSLMPNKEGKWRLSRVKGWREMNPTRR